MKNKKAFTLIELIAVLVILAILALIVTPLVLNIVRTAKDSANKRSVDAYGKSIELAIASYLLDKGDFPTSINDLKVEYTGKELVCKVQQLNDDSSVYLSECTVGGTEVKDLSTDDGWYHYGENKSKYDYKIGDEVTYNGMNFYVIENSKKGSDIVTLLKAEPLTVDEVNIYGHDHVNRYTYDSVGTAKDQNGYGGMAYYTSETCGYVTPGDYDSWVETGCTTDYDKSDIKYVVDAWAADKIQASDLAVDAAGYSVRLIAREELINNLGYELWRVDTEIASPSVENTPNWVYKNNYDYWTMSVYNDSDTMMWHIVSVSPGLFQHNIYDVKDTFNTTVVRPVVILLKSAI